MSEDLLEETTVASLTQEDYDRAYKLDAGIKKLALELEELKARIKAEAKTGTKIHGNVIVKVSERKDKDIAAMEEKYPLDGYADFYKHVLDVSAVPKENIILKPAIKVVSISFAEAD